MSEEESALRGIVEGSIGGGVRRIQEIRAQLVVPEEALVLQVYWLTRMQFAGAWKDGKPFKLSPTSQDLSNPDVIFPYKVLNNLDMTEEQEESLMPRTVILEDGRVFLLHRDNWKGADASAKKQYWESYIFTGRALDFEAMWERVGKQSPQKILSDPSGSQF